MNHYVVTLCKLGFTNTGKSVEVEARDRYQAQKIGAKKLKTKMAFVCVQNVMFRSIP